MRKTLLLTILAASQVEKVISRMEAAEGYLQADTTVEKDAALYPEKFKKNFPDAESTQALAALHKEMERLAPRWTFPDGPHDARLEGFALKGVGAWHAGGKVLKTVMKPNAWKIPKTRLGIPLKRTRAGVVLYKMPTDTLCRQQALL